MARRDRKNGNRRAVSHGGYAAVVAERLDEKVHAVYEALSADAPLRDATGELPRHDHAQVVLLAECLSRLEDVRAHLRDFGLFDRKTKQPRPALEVERHLRREAADYLDALGMTPRSRAKLGVDLTRTFDLAQAMAADAERERRDGEAATETGPAGSLPLPPPGVLLPKNGEGHA
jgi:hypothetical protein